MMYVMQENKKLISMLAFDSTLKICHIYRDTMIKYKITKIHKYINTFSQRTFIRLAEDIVPNIRGH